MENTTYVTGETARVLSATTAARIRNTWLRTGVVEAPVFTQLQGEKCVSMTTLGGHTGAPADHGFAINPFRTRSGPPWRTA